MNNKNKLGVLVSVVGLMSVVLAYAQSGPMGVSNDGLTFPDGSTQTTAANAGVKQPLIVTGEFSSSLSSSTGFYTGSTTLYTVPVGKILVVETVSMNDYVGEGAGVDLYFWIDPSSTGNRTFRLRVERTLPLFSGTSIDGIFATEALKIRLAAGGVVECAGKSTSSLFSPACAFSGYLEDAP